MAPQTLWTQEETTTRAEQILAKHGLAPVAGNLYRVQSQSAEGRSYVVSYRGTWACQCDFFAETGKFCIHVAAARLYKRTGDQEQGVRPMTYPQAWTAYNTAQASEIRLFDSLLADLVESLPAEDGPRKRGNQPLPLQEQVFVAVQKVYSQLSSRRAQTLFGYATERGQLDHAPHFNAPTKFINRPEATPILRSLIQQSAVPLAGLEHDFAVDSTGFCTNVRGDYRMGKYGGVAPRQWVKGHLCVGVKTHIVADAIVTPSEGEGTGDSSNFQPLVESLRGRFDVDEVSADKAYISKKNLAVVQSVGGEAIIPFKGGLSTPHGGQASGSSYHNAVGYPGSAKLWRKAFHYFQLNAEEFWARYHKRSNIESVNSAIKRKFGETLKSRNPVAQTNELLCKILAYNLTVLIHEMHEAGISPDFCTPIAPVAPGIVLGTH